MSVESDYDPTFYEKETVEARESSHVIVPIVLETIRPGSVVDIGCGTGAWLSTFQEFGVKDVLGLDGNYVDTKRLLIPHEYFQAVDLTQPLHLKKSFDLAVSLEVAEHLEPKYAGGFVEALCAASPVVLFSAAVPGQGGIHHVNEHWPGYWHQLFAQQNYRMFDPIRYRVWHNEQVTYYYRQNIFLFARDDVVESNPAFQKLPEVKDADSLNNLMLVSAPILNLHLYRGLGATVKSIPGLLWEAVLRRTGKATRSKLT